MISSNGASKSTKVRLSSVMTVALGLAILTTGCSGEKPAGAQKRLPVFKVKGVVMYNGQPVDGAHVSFHPKEEGQPGPFGKTNEAGEYTLRTYADGPAGAPEGDYIITVQKSVGGSTEESKSGPELFAEMERQAKLGQHGKPEVPTSFIPEKYAKKQSSNLKATVKSGDPNEFDLDLKN